MGELALVKDMGSDITLSVKGSSKSWTKKKKIWCGVTGVVFVVVLVLVIVFLVVKSGSRSETSSFCGVLDVPTMDEVCRTQRSQSCGVKIVESIPENLTFSKDAPSHISVFDGWIELLDAAETSIHIASSYWTLRGDDIHVKDNSSWQGQEIFDRLVEAGKRGHYLMF